MQLGGKGVEFNNWSTDLICFSEMFLKWICFQIYYHGEPIKVHVDITNKSSKTIKNIIVSGKTPLLLLVGF